MKNSNFIRCLAAAHSNLYSTLSTVFPLKREDIALCYLHCSRAGAHKSHSSFSICFSLCLFLRTRDYTVQPVKQSCSNFIHGWKCESILFVSRGVHTWLRSPVDISSMDESVNLFYLWVDESTRFSSPANISSVDERVNLFYLWVEESTNGSAVLQIFRPWMKVWIYFICE